MSRSDLKDLGETLDTGQSAVVAVAATAMADRVAESLKNAEKVDRKELKADPAEVKADVAAADPAADTSAFGGRRTHGARRASGRDRRTSGPVHGTDSRWPAGSAGPGCRRLRSIARAPTQPEAVPTRRTR